MTFLVLFTTLESFLTLFTLLEELYSRTGAMWKAGRKGRSNNGMLTRRRLRTEWDYVRVEQTEVTPSFRALSSLGGVGRLRGYCTMVTIDVKFKTY